MRELAPMPHDRFGSGILADWQIKELSLSEETRMIRPFVAVPVRVVGGGPTPSLKSMHMEPGEGAYESAKKMHGDALVKAGPGRKVISYGLGHYGYDMRVADKFKVFSNLNMTVVDPKKVDERMFHEVEGDCVIPPNSFALSRSVECFHIPRGVMAMVIGKSTYARCGLVVNVTPLEPEWRGHVTLEISNTTPLPAKVYANEGIAQVVFFWASAECRTSYADKKGKYMDQPAEIVVPRM